MDDVGHAALLAELDDFPLDLRHTPAIEMVSKSGTIFTSADSTHVVNRSIASKTGRLN